MAAKRVVAGVVAVAAVLMMVVVQPSEAAPEDEALRFPGRAGSRPRNPVFPGYPRASRPSSPATSGGGSPAPPTPPPSSRPPPPPPPCTRSPLPVEPPGGFPLVPGFPGLPGSSGGGGSAPSSSPTECVTPLAGLMTCGTFLTGSEPETPTPQSQCCSGLGAFLNSSGSSAAAAGGGDRDRTLRCLCPVILGDVNKMLPKPIDPVRLMYLPIACGVVLPPQVLYICFTGQQQSPPLVGRIPDVWEKPTSAALSP